MLEDKLRDIEATGAEVCAAVDSSCLMQISGGLRRQRSGMRTLHVAEILAARA
jgi:L-lactate dehydrogenase complex protein LldE